MSFLRGKIVVVTGSTRGFGNSVARALLQAGAAVIVSGRKQMDVDRVVAKLSPMGYVGGLACDVSVAEQVYALARYAVERFGRLDIWVNNAGITPTAGGILDFPPETAERVFQVNCLGVFNGTQSAFQIMRKQGSGTVVNIYGRGGDLSSASPSGLYGTTKAWITSFTRTLADEYGGSGVQIVGFSPGMMTTDMMDVQEVVGEQVADTMRYFSKVVDAIGNHPDVPAQKLIELLETNRDAFVEYHFVHGWHTFLMVTKLLWVRYNPFDRPAAASLALKEPFVPPVP